MAARTKARKRALDVLFESEVRGLPLDGTLAERLEAQDPPIGGYSVELVRGVAEHQDRIDELLTTYAEGWTLDRMPSVDRNVLRLGVYELLYAEDVPDAVALSEAVALVQDLSTDESPSFVNGVLGAIQRHKTSAAP
ncbi:MAG: Transcription termination protein NusB [uncultured Nocardioidaceae bacterium]|uniref:Transcription antitermination protein NusB n=1 Tax=uncultured Nocardioidaceae bacterium TaxID=253824 RepID=A0A6J4MJW2_9ACTN|nr:MAG: Transcription termination protein NusB [uncultured Nocardioidaceae bacterium]